MGSVVVIGGGGGGIVIGTVLFEGVAESGFVVVLLIEDVDGVFDFAGTGVFVTGTTLLFACGINLVLLLVALAGVVAVFFIIFFKNANTKRANHHL